MTKFSKIATGAASLAAFGLLLAPVSLADTGCSISGNGARSRNTCTVRVNKAGACKRWFCTASGSAQTNNANVTNNVTVHSKTGGNRANENTNGAVSITTGASNVNITITNTVNSNTAN